MFACRRFTGIVVASLVLTLGCLANAFAFPVTWTLSGVTFDDGGTASGYFVYDADNAAVLQASIAVAGGNTGTFPPMTYGQDGGGSLGAGFYFWAPGFGRYLEIVSTGLSDAGGTVALSTQSYECTNCGSVRYVSAGNVIGTVYPQITSANATTFTVGTAGSFTATAATASNWTETGSLPSGVTFVDNGDGTATLSGTPAAGTGGTYALTLTASTGVPPDATQDFTLTVFAPFVVTPTPTLTWPGATVLLLLLLAAAFYGGRRQRSVR